MTEFKAYMRSLAVAGSLLLVLIFVEAAPVKPAVASGQKAAAKVDAVELYKTNCQACHGPDGNSVLQPLSFTDPEWKHGTRLQDIVKVITEGVEMTPMLPFKEKLSKAEILALAKLVRSYDKSLAAVKAPAKKPVKKNG
jgi:mono/diheme cytochrome c family protein